MTKTKPATFEAFTFGSPKNCGSHQHCGMYPGVATLRAKAVSMALLSCLLSMGPQEAAAQTPHPEPSHATCLDLLESTEQFNLSGRALVRVLWGGEIMEPVLIRRKGTRTRAELSFKDCSAGVPIETTVSEADLIFFDSALVARFFQKNSVLTKYHEDPQGGFEPAGEAEFDFRGTGGMLEARRLGDDHVEVTKSELVGGGVDILLVATRKAVEAMDLGDWEEGWRNNLGDSQIKREIIWWELRNSEALRVHPAVANFDELAHRAQDRSAAKAEIDWDRVLEENLDTFLTQGAFSLIVVVQPGHIDFVKRMRRKARETGSDVVVDVAQLEKKRRRRLKQGKETGESWSLVDFSGLAAIMPMRIAGIIRGPYRHSSSNKAGMDITKVAIATDPGTFQVANGIFQDQVAGLASRLRFLECLLEDANKAQARIQVLNEGFKLMNIPTAGLNGKSVSEALRLLLQGFNLPPSLRAGELDFLTSVSSGNPEALDLIRLLKAYFHNASLEPGNACKAVLIPDAALLSRPLLVPGTPSSDAETAAATQGSRNTISSAKYEARKSQSVAIYAGADKYSLPQMERCYRLFKKGKYVEAKHACDSAAERSEKKSRRGAWSLPSGPFTLGVESWNASISADDLDGDTAIFSGAFLSWDLSDRLWLSAGYTVGEIDVTAAGLINSLEEVNSDLVIGWSFPRFDIGFGYRLAEIRTRTSAGTSDTSSAGPMIYLGGADLFGQLPWGYYWKMAYLSEDMDDDDGTQKILNGEVGIRWASRKNASVLLGYRRREYSGYGAGVAFGGPVVSIAYTWR